jgi:hypothetical protein
MIYETPSYELNFNDSPIIQIAFSSLFLVFIIALVEISLLGEVN